MKGFVGIDGCKVGWFSVSLFDEQPWELRVFSNIEEIWSNLSHAKLLLIDIPIGLRDEGSDARKCDFKARKLLGAPRSSSVFPPPARPALDCQTRQEALRKNYSLTGRKINKQTWGIVPKIREVDQFLRTTPEAKEKIREIHPELLFWALNGRMAMAHNKKRLEGFVQRLQVLRRHFPRCDELVIEALTEFPRNQVSKDDVLDALAAAVTALCPNVHLATIPKVPDHDAYGLPMEMVYYTQE